MRKLMMFIGILSLSIILVGCTGDEEVKTPPSFVSVTVDGSDPVSDGNLVPFYKAKQESTLITVEITNPDNVEVTAIVINGYNYLASRFTETSTATVKTFTMSAGTTLGARDYSVDEIVYMDGDTSKSSRNFTQNEFQLYVYKDTPTVERENYQLFRDSISIDFNVTDPDAVIQTDTLTAKLFSGETLVEEQVISSGLVTVLFEDLLADKQYEIKVEATYDVDNNEGLQSNIVMYSGTFQTLSNALPSAIIQNIVVESNNVDFDVAFTDDNNVVVAAGLTVGVFLDDTLVDETTLTGSTTGISFTGLLNDTEYVLKVLADYDLRDGANVLEDNVIALGSFTTLPKEVPTPELENLEVSQNKIDFDIAIDDPTGIIDKDSLVATLYFEDTEIDSADLDEYFVGFNVNNVFANYEFTIKIFGDYNLNNGDGLQVNQEIFSQTFSTLEKARPSIVVDSTTVSQGYVTMSLEVQDSNEALLGALEAVLYEEGTPVKTVQFNAGATEIIFDYATVYTNLYSIEIKADYNLSDGTGAKIDALLYKEVLVTLQKKTPIAEIKDLTSTTDQISFNVDVIDADATIDAGSTKLYVYLEGTLIETIDLSTGSNSVIVDTLLSNNLYEFVVESDFDLEDSSGLLTEQVLSETSFSTLPKSLPTAIFEPGDITTTTESIKIDAEIIDEDVVILPGTIFAELYLDGVLIESLALDNGENFNKLFTTSLLSDTEYIIKITADYDLDDGNDPEADYLLVELGVTTNAKQVPNATYNFLDADKDSITVDIVLQDLDDVITGNVIAQLMLGDTEITTETLLETDAVQNVTFTGLDSNARYYINILADYDLNDNETVETGAIIHSGFITTDAYLEPTALISNVVPGTDNIVFDVSVTDDENVITGNLIAALYNGTNLVTSKTLLKGTNTAVTFDGLTSDTDYEIRILADYDLNETSGPVTGNDGLLDTFETATEPIDVVIIESEVIDKTTNTVEVSINDVEDVLSDNFLKATLYEGTQIKATYILSKETNTYIDMFNLLSDFEYTLVIDAEYESNPLTYETIYTHTFTTDPMLLPTVEIDIDWESLNPIAFDVVVGADDDNVVNDTSYEVDLYVNGVFETSQTIANPEGGTVTVTFAGYDATDGNAYTIIVKALVDLNDVDGQGEVETAIASRTFINASDAS